MQTRVFLQSVNVVYVFAAEFVPDPSVIRVFFYSFFVLHSCILLNSTLSDSFEDVTLLTRYVSRVCT